MSGRTGLERLHFTGDAEADRLLVTEPMALLMGFLLDQQVTVQKAFSGPLELRRRIGTLDPATLATMDPLELDAAFRQRPALHRFPADMARRTRALCQALVQGYEGDAQRVWMEATDARDLRGRLLELPGMGAMKADGLLAVLIKRFGLRPPGWEAELPDHPTLGDVESADGLADYQAGKRARKAAARSSQA